MITKNKIWTLLFKPNDWRLVDSHRATWINEEGTEKTTNYYHFYFSSSRLRYKIKLYGHSPKKHPDYRNIVLKKLAHLNLKWKGNNRL